MQRWRQCHIVNQAWGLHQQKKENMFHLIISLQTLGKHTHIPQKTISKIYHMRWNNGGEFNLVDCQMYDKTANSKSSNVTYTSTCLFMSTQTLKTDPLNLNFPISRKKKKPKRVDPPNATGHQCFKPYSNTFSLFKLSQNSTLSSCRIILLLSSKNSKNFMHFCLHTKLLKGPTSTNRTPLGRRSSLGVWITWFGWII